MDKVAILCSRDSMIMHDFSELSLERLKDRSFFCMPLPFLRTYMKANVGKEIDKDRLIIEYAAARFREGRTCCDHDIGEMFEMTKQVDKAFLRKVNVPSLTITIRYEDIASIRKSRIDSLSRCVHDLLAHWKDDLPVESAVRAAYRKQDFQDMITEILHLYNQETRQLSNSIRAFGPFQMAVETFAGALYRAMEQAAEDLTAAYTRAIYGRRAA
ncbi:MAG TPA: hypothetical protein VN604_05790 [Nitrospirota bacterium]|nr:hypothetical protein [Nitrospirota bacterium]